MPLIDPKITPQQITAEIVWQMRQDPPEPFSLADYAIWFIVTASAIALIASFVFSIVMAAGDQ